MKSSNFFLNTARAFLFSAIIVLFLICVVSAIFTFTSPSDILQTALSYVFLYLLIFLFSFFSSLRLHRLGYLWGGTVGMCLALCLMTLGTFIFKTGFGGTEILKTLFLSFLCGAVGGITGINLGNKAK